MEEDSVNLQNERRDRIRNLLEQQGKEIENFDAESLRMGFSTVVITNYGDQVFVDPHVKVDSQNSGHPSHMHPSASTSALGQSGHHTSNYNMPRSNSGSSIRTTGAPGQPSGISQQPGLQSGHAYSHRSSRPVTDTGRVSSRPAQGQIRHDAANNNRNNSSRPGTSSSASHRQAFDPVPSGQRGFTRSMQGASDHGRQLAYRNPAHKAIRSGAQADSSAVSITLCITVPSNFQFVPSIFL